MEADESFWWFFLNRYMNAEKYDLDRIYFGGCFIRGWINSSTLIVCSTI